MRWDKRPSIDGMYRYCKYLFTAISEWPTQNPRSKLRGFCTNHRGECHTSSESCMSLSYKVSEDRPATISRMISIGLSYTMLSRSEYLMLLIVQLLLAFCFTVVHDEYLWLRSGLYRDLFPPLVFSRHCSLLIPSLTVLLIVTPRLHARIVSRFVLAVSVCLAAYATLELVSAMHTIIEEYRLNSH